MLLGPEDSGGGTSYFILEMPYIMREDMGVCLNRVGGGDMELHKVGPLTGSPDVTCRF